MAIASIFIGGDRFNIYLISSSVVLVIGFSHYPSGSLFCHLGINQDGK
ncbi:hypothetical protein [Fischerella thermalis]|nr:hypothetical protein [Fischerella thermalis]